MTEFCPSHKIVYDSRRDAKVAQHGGNRAYRCPHCGMYHVGHPHDKRIKSQKRRHQQRWAA